MAAEDPEFPSTRATVYFHLDPGADYTVQPFPGYPERESEPFVTLRIGELSILLKAPAAVEELQDAVFRAGETLAELRPGWRDTGQSRIEGVAW